MEIENDHDSSSEEDDSDSASEEMDALGLDSSEKAEEELDANKKAELWKSELKYDEMKKYAANRSKKKGERRKPPQSESSKRRLKGEIYKRLNILCGKRYGGVAILHLHFPNKVKSTTRARTFPKKGFARSFLDARSKFSTEFFEVCAAKSLNARLGGGDKKIQKEKETPLANSKEIIVHDDLQTANETQYEKGDHRDRAEGNVPNNEEQLSQLLSETPPPDAMFPTPVQSPLPCESFISVQRTSSASSVFTNVDYLSPSPATSVPTNNLAVSAALSVSIAAESSSPAALIPSVSLAGPVTAPVPAAAQFPPLGTFVPSDNLAGLTASPVLIAAHSPLPARRMPSATRAGLVTTPKTSAFGVKKLVTSAAPTHKVSTKRNNEGKGKLHSSGTLAGYASSQVPSVSQSSSPALPIQSAQSGSTVPPVPISSQSRSAPETILSDIGVGLATTIPKTSDFSAMKLVTSAAPPRKVSTKKKDLGKGKLRPSDTLDGSSPLQVSSVVRSSPPALPIQSAQAGSTTSIPWEVTWKSEDGALFNMTYDQFDLSYLAPGKFLKLNVPGQKKKKLQQCFIKEVVVTGTKVTKW